MQFRDLGAQYARLKPEIDAGVQAVIESHAFINGKPVQGLERELAAYAGVKHCIACASGTDALILPLMAWGVGPGDAVFAPDFTYFASVNCAMLRGAVPVLVDIDARTFNMSPEALEAAVVRTLAEGRLRPRVIIPVDLFGQPAEHAAIQRIAEKYGLLVLEDAAQGFGGSIGGRLACSFGDAAATSFFPAKPLGCYGDGGAIFTNDDALTVTLRSMRMQGSSLADKYDNISIGLNSRLDTLQAAVLLPKLRALIAHELADADRAAARYTARLQSIEGLVTPYVAEGCFSSWAQYTILLPDRACRDGLQQAMKAAGIPTMIYYPRGMHQQTAIRESGFDSGAFPVTENIVGRCLSLPMGPYLTEADQDLVVQEIERYMR